MEGGPGYQLEGFIFGMVKVIEVKGQIYVFVLFVPLRLQGPWADLHQTWWEG